MQHKPVIKPFDSPFIELLTTDSTNNYALDLARQGRATHGTAVFAHEQTAGKGQMGRRWSTEKEGNIALSIVLQPAPLTLSQQFQLSACVAIAVHTFFKQYAGEDTRIKWPNDLYWQNRKAGGILIESVVGGESPQAGLVAKGLTAWKWAVAGIGINVNQGQFAPELTNPVSLKQITGKNFDQLLLAKELWRMIMDSYTSLIDHGFNNILTAYNNSLYKLNEPATFRKGNSVFTKTVKGVSASGQLLTLHDSFEEQYDFGEISWVI